jgi:23S rRNA (guanosine2251-2'-O)-methyltransferase
MVMVMQKQDHTYIYGVHVIEEALKYAPHAVKRLYVLRGPKVEGVRTSAKKLGIPVDTCEDDHLPQGVDSAVNHQGLIAEVIPSKLQQEYRPFIDRLEITPKTALVLLDELTDPQNVGAIIRNAAGFGIAGVLIPEYRQAQVTGTVVKVSAGMAFTVPLVSVGNVNTTLRDLKDRGFWVYGLVGDGETSLPKEDFTKPSVFVLGNEGRGLREKTEELCDFRLSIPIMPNCESLNVGASAAVVFYAWRTGVTTP